MEATLTERFRGAFPNECADEVDVVGAMLRPSSHPTSEFDVGPTEVRGERLRIPTRIYHPELAPQELAALSDRQRLVAQCWFTRHHDGYVRERMVREVLRDRSPWTAPYVIQLLGEYVIEIIQVLQDGIVAKHEQPYAEFLNDNPEFWELTRQRMISYWNCCYRHPDYPDRSRYPGARLFERLEGWRASGAASSSLSLESVLGQLRARHRVEPVAASAEQLVVRFPKYPDAVLGIALQSEGRLRVTYPRVVRKPSGEYHEVEATADRVLPEGLHSIAGQLARHGRVLPEFVDGPLPLAKRHGP